MVIGDSPVSEGKERKEEEGLFIGKGSVWRRVEIVWRVKFPVTDLEKM